MITQLQIEKHVEEKSSVCLEVFSSIVSTRSKATRSQAISTAEMYCGKVLESLGGHVTVTGVSPIKAATQAMNLDALVSLVCGAEIEMREVDAVKKIMKSDFLRNLTLLWISFMYDLDFSSIKNLRASDRDVYLEVGDAIFLSGLYLGLQDIND